MTTSPTAVQIAAAAAAAVAVTLIVVMDWVPTPLNRNIVSASVRDRLPSTIIHIVVGAAAVAACLGRHRWLIFAAAVWFTIVLGVAAVNWWLPYLTGVTIGEIDLASFQSEYAANPRLLPAIAGHVIVPDIQHMIIHAGLLAACVTSWSAFARAWST